MKRMSKEGLDIARSHEQKAGQVDSTSEVKKPAEQPAAEAAGNPAKKKKKKKKKESQPFSRWSEAEEARWNFFSPTWWRWEHAVVRATQPFEPATRMIDDPMTLAAVAFIQSSFCGTPQEQIAEQHPHFAKAEAVFVENGEARWALEAYTLAGISQEEIAEKLGLDLEFLRLYETVFFDVRPRLLARDWICHHNYGLGGPARGFRADEVGSLWRWVGYAGGEYALDAVRAVMTGIGKSNYPKGLVESIVRFVALGPFLAECSVSELNQRHLQLIAQARGIKLPGMRLASYCRTLAHGAGKTCVAPRNLTATKTADTLLGLSQSSANRTDQTGLENAWECQPRLQNCPEHDQREASADLLGHGSASHDLMQELLDIDELVKFLEERQS